MFEIFKNAPDVLATWSLVPDGDMRLAANAGQIENRERFMRRIGIGPERLASAGLVHGDTIHFASVADGGKIIPGTDALIASDNDLFLSITVADCLPVFLHHPGSGALALVHAGWRGLAAGIIGKTIVALSEQYAAPPQELLAGIGPGICPRHYEVGENVAARFISCLVAVKGANGATMLDLPFAARAFLIEAGVPDGSIETFPACTYEEPSRYFSFRRERIVPPRVIMAVFGRRKGI